MGSLNIEQQANMYLFELNSCAREYWFKPDEGWELSLATNEERQAIERKYKPTHTTTGLPETLLQMHGMVKAQLVQPGFYNNSGLTVNTKELKCLIAFNPDRLR
ncbi:MAG: hypothetical protein K0S09_3229 [Sphingobacteriaceae bacterium]|nr:hypothetical protein [Sphingobacteriaceae bacterium]